MKPEQHSSCQPCSTSFGDSVKRLRRWPPLTVGCAVQCHISTGPYAILHFKATCSLTVHSFAAAGCSTTMALACLQEKLFHKIEDDYGLDPHGIEVGAAYTLVALS